LPYTFDISIFTQIDNDDLIKHILRVGKPFYFKENGKLKTESGAKNNSQLPKGWEVKKLGEVCDIQLGKTPHRKTESLWDKGKETSNIWLSIADMQHGKILYDSKEYISNLGIKNIKYVPKGTLMLSFKLTLGRVSFAGKNLFTNEAIASLVKLSTKIDKNFLFYYFSFFDWNKETEGDFKVKGRTLNKEKLKALNIILPPLSEQKRIIAILEYTFKAIDQAKTNAEQNLKNAKELFESYLNRIFEEKGDDWEGMALGDEKLLKIIDGDRGKNYPRKSDFKDDDFCLFMNTKNVRTDGFLFESKMYITREKDESMGKGKLARNDVVLTTRGTIGNIGIYNEDVPYENIRINSGMLIFRPNQEVVTSRYLFELFRSSIMKDLIKRHASGAAQPQLPIKTLINFRFPIPSSLEEQQQIVKKLNSLSAKTKKLEAIYQKKLDNLEELKKSILDKAFKGGL
jgi:type I restriction enzyme S subunit